MFNSFQYNGNILLKNPKSLKELERRSDANRMKIS